MTSSPTPNRGVVRTLLLGIAATWLLLVVFMRSPDLIDLVQRLAFGVALIAVALVDWQRFRWWWVLLALLLVAAVWMATGHPPFFLFGSI
jgi:hypothetical protein